MPTANSFRDVTLRPVGASQCVDKLTTAGPNGRIADRSSPHRSTEILAAILGDAHFGITARWPRCFPRRRRCSFVGKLAEDVQEPMIPAPLLLRRREDRGE